MTLMRSTKTAFASDVRRCKRKKKSAKSLGKKNKTKKFMTKKVFKAFGEKLSGLRQQIRNEGRDWSALKTVEIVENMFVEVAKTFNEKFDEKRFRNACRVKT